MLRASESGSAAVTHHRLRPAKIDEASRGQIKLPSLRSDAHGPNTPLVTVIESNRFSECEKAVHLLGFPATCQYAGKRTAQQVLGGRSVLSGVLSGGNPVVVNSGEPRKALIDAGVEGRTDQNS
jgi:hypothetical protein